LREGSYLEKRFNITKIDAKGGKLLGEGKQVLREGTYLEKGFNILEIGTEGWKLHRKHPQICA
jgi:hypothetical protein